jgi:hypothetical protein
VILYVQVAILQVWVQQQVDCVRQGISEVFPIEKLDQLSGLDLIDIIGAKPTVDDEDWECMIAMITSASAEMDTCRKLVQDALRLAKSSESGDGILLFGAKVNVEKFRRDFCSAIFGVPQANTSDAITFTTDVKHDLPGFFNSCSTELQIRPSRSLLTFKTSIVSRATAIHHIIVEGAHQMQLKFIPHPVLSSLQGIRDPAARVSRDTSI